jgi:choline dehydrogenase-like flavoprotein
LLLLKTLAALAYTRDPRVWQAVGASQRCAVSGERPRSEPAALPLATRDLAPPEGVERCDVVVVGSGAGGAAAARALAERGLSVIVVEEGEYHDASSYSRDPLESLPQLYRDAGLTACEGRPVIPLPVGRCVGGTTVVNSGTCLRARESVLVRWRKEFGIAWATDLDAEFESLEHDLRVTPVDPATAGRNAELCRIGAEAIGASNGPIARNAGDVVCCGTCPTGCALDAKQAAHVSELPRAAAAGGRIRANARAERVIVEAGRAVGVICQVPRAASFDGHARRYEVRARAVVLAAGAIGTPELLLRQGLAGSSSALGRHLRIHPACWVGAAFEEEVRGWEGVMQSWLVDEWLDRGLFLEATFTPLGFGAHWLGGTGHRFKERLERYGRIAIIGVHLSDRSEGRVDVRGRNARIRYRLREEDAARICYGIARAADIHFAAGAREVYPQVGRVRAIAPGEQEAVVERGRFGPGDLRLEAFHPMGTARMAADPRVSVVAPSGEAHDLPGLYVVDASIFPTSLNANPMLTVMACARRIAAGVADRVA